ncbi:hypothetical protein HELRODRAFT_165372 [Helobdella robusta]|uniref:Uncharacterized protein n=1 Tax=Helobdella robusta TaxID=6412 RepID=T1EWN7_HELRO|nr:hypothetical protein HELRODRAFT_165372 [Helobdella robusta]ESN91349.1 hypothetical protein HELRODRAFT_165372 [Helobdella robusta]
MCKGMKKCDKYEMYGVGESFVGSDCKTCCKLEELDRKYNEQHDKIAQLEQQLVELLSNKKSTSENEFVKKQFKEQKSPNKETWTTVVRKSVDKELKVVQETVKSVEEKVELNAEEGKRKERKRNNIVIHKLTENNASEAKEKNTADRKSVTFLFNEVLKIPCENTDIKKRDQCRELVKESKIRQSKETSGEFIFKVKGLPGDMRIVKLKKY